jgi:anti-sigma B factor antagonist
MLHHFEIHRREKEGITIFDVKGRLVVGEPSTLLRERLNQEVSQDVKQIVLNLQNVDYIDSTGLGTMVICYTTLHKSGGALTLVHLNRRNLELMVLTKLSTIFQIFAEEQDAVNSFFPEREIKHFDILSFVQQHREGE